jgi:uridine phosphorylase
MKELKKMDLILNPDGSIYHLQLLPGELAGTVILVGDPATVPKVSKHFDEIEIRRNSREFVTHTGRLNGFRVSVISTGIGTDNIDIVINEIDALHNIDFVTHHVKDTLTQLKLIRIGRSATIQNDIAIDSLLVSAKAVGFDVLGTYYDTPQNRNCIDKTNAFLYKLSTLVQTENMPYLCNASDMLLDQVTAKFSKGITATMPGFYAAQGRSLRAKSKLTRDLISFLSELSFDDDRITNIETETAGIYLLASILGHQAISFNAIVANRITDEYSNHSEETLDGLIGDVLEIYLK